jgi:hypothetical protein
LGGFGFEMSEEFPRRLTPKEAAGMTVNERLWLSGQMSAFEEAAAQCDVERMTEILSTVHLNRETIEANIRSELNKK